MYKTMALEIKVIPTLTGEDAVRFVNNAESVSNGRERIDFSAQIADAREILKNARNAPRHTEKAERPSPGQSFLPPASDFRKS